MSAHTLQHAIEAYEKGAWPEAEKAIGEILRESPDNPDALQLLGNIRARSGDTRAAEPLFERARAAAPGNIFILNSLGGVYGANGKTSEARAALEAALAIDSRFPWALQNLGCVMLELGERPAARRLFERALASKPDFADAMASLADLAEKDRRIEDAQQLIGRALRLAPKLVAPRLVLARLKLRAGEYQEVDAGVSALLAHDAMRPADRATAHGILGQALEGLGRYDEAFTSFAAANEIERSLHGPQYADMVSTTSFATIDRLSGLLKAGKDAAWRKPGAPDDRAPVFLVGFPRSGTTLLDQVLASHPDVETLEEHDNLTDAATKLILADGGLARWDDLSAEEIGNLRKAYWRRVEAGLGHPRRCRLFVDKLPLYIILLPLIHRVFPDARIILALRDPRDVTISCFRNRFAMNAAMFQFLSLETTARYYDAVMRLGELARASLSLKLHVLRYEDVIGDFRVSIGGLLDFLGLPWTEDVTNYAETASRRNIRTPSATQVIKPLYRSSLGQWRHYETQLRPVLPILDPWVRAFGYEMD